MYGSEDATLCRALIFNLLYLLRGKKTAARDFYRDSLNFVIPKDSFYEKAISYLNEEIGELEQILA